MKKSIVIVNQFTNKRGVSKGSRGRTPGQYVVGYLSREGAAEPLSPVRYNDIDGYITRYMARRTATDMAVSVPDVYNRISEAEGDGGVAFGFGSVSLSHKRAHEAAQEVQRLYDAGHTVMKTVISFDGAYLKRHGIVDEDFECSEAGDYRGNIDQLKLRLAIMSGLSSVAKKHYDDLQFIGIIHTNTKSVHCHLAMVDRGEGTLAVDGTQKGKLSEQVKRRLRYGIETFLDKSDKHKRFTLSTNRDRQNAAAHVKGFTYRAIESYGAPQFLMACLPHDRRLWRAGTNNTQMRKANAVAHEYVRELFKQPDSGYEPAMEGIREFARHRANKEGEPKRYDKYVRDGEKKLTDSCINSVYSVLKQIPDGTLREVPQFMAIMSLDYEQIAQQAKESQSYEFGFRLRTYSSRARHHRSEMYKYRGLKEQHDSSQQPPEAKPVRDFYAFEEEYNAQLLSKYQHFLPLLTDRRDYEDEREKIERERERALSMRRALKDPAMQAYKSADGAEVYASIVYGFNGGGEMVRDRAKFETRIDRIERRADVMQRRFERILRDDGALLNDGAYVRTDIYPFNDVKALDIHHLGYDWSHTVMVSEGNKRRFIETAEQRKALCDAAAAYLRNSGRDDEVALLPIADVERMSRVSERLAEDSRLAPSNEFISAAKARSNKSVPTEKVYAEVVHDAVRKAIKQVVADSDYFGNS